MINFIKLKIASIPLSGKILTLTENTSFLLRKEGVKAFLFTLLKKMSCLFSPCLQEESFFTLAPWCSDLDCHMSHSLAGRCQRSGFWSLSWTMQFTSQSSCFRPSDILGRYIYLVIHRSWFQLICRLEIHMYRKKNNGSPTKNHEFLIQLSHFQKQHKK